jgi:hypothetical protein
MKRFDELTVSEKKNAISYATSELNHCIQIGLIVFKNKVTKKMIKEYAIAMAEDAWYAQSDDNVVTGIVTEERI